MSLGRRTTAALALGVGAWTLASGVALAATVIDHNHTRISEIPPAWISEAKATLRIAYGHTSHGSQLVTGMSAVRAHYGAAYSFASGGAGGALDLRDTPFSGASDLGAPDRTSWAAATRSYLAANPTVNVIIWSWCGEVSWATEADINTYLTLMSQLEADFPGVKFVYMTGHLDGGGSTGNLHLRNEQIRNYCRNNNKVLFDFTDIESYDPNRSTYYLPLFATDGCTYTQGGITKNWATDWIVANQGHELSQVSSVCGDCAHSERLNCVQKGGAAWWLWARLAGWAGPAGLTMSIGNSSVAEGSSGSSPASFTVSLTAASAVPVTVNWATADGTANQGADYVAGSGTLTFNPGVTQQTLSVSVRGDTLDEPDETFRVVLSSATNATITDGDGLGTILNDDVAVAKGFHALPACRLLDTRQASQGPALAANIERTVGLAANCGIPLDAAAVAVNVTAVSATAAGNVTVFPSGITRPIASTVNYTVNKARGNNAVVKLGASGDVKLYATQGSGSVQLVVDVTGYFDPPAAP